MFERNKIDTPSEQSTLTVEVTLDDGRLIVGKFLLPTGRGLLDTLNAQGGFIEFQSFEGERSLLAKGTIRGVRQMTVARAERLDTRVRDGDGFDPYAILGIAAGTPWEDVRHAYLALSKTYHPDRYASAELPAEVRTYLSTMARRVNSAYQSLEKARASRPRPTATSRAEPVFTSPGR